VDAINKATSDIQEQYDNTLNRRTKQITAATSVSFLKALAYDDKHNLGLKQGVLVCNRDTGMPMHVLPAQNALFSNNKTKNYFPGNTYMMKGNQRGRLVNHLMGHILMQQIG